MSLHDRVRRLASDRLHADPDELIALGGIGPYDGDSTIRAKLGQLTERYPKLSSLNDMFDAVHAPAADLQRTQTSRLFRRQ